jgi:hypothetical protein
MTVPRAHRDFDSQRILFSPLVLGSRKAGESKKALIKAVAHAFDVSAACVRGVQYGK